MSSAEPEQTAKQFLVSNILNKSDSRQRPGLAQRGKLLAAYLVDSVRTLPEEVQERLLEFRQIGELGWRHKEEETRKKMIRYWTEEVVEDQTSYTEVLLLPYYLASHCNLKLLVAEHTGLNTRSRGMRRRSSSSAGRSPGRSRLSMWWTGGGAAVRPGRGRPPPAAAAEQYKIKHNKLPGQSVELVSLKGRENKFMLGMRQPRTLATYAGTRTCQINRAAKWNTRTALMSADNSQLANIILGGMASYAGAAFSVVMGTTVRVNVMNYRPTADTDGICCEIPVTFLDRMKNRVAFMKVDLVAGYEEENNACTGQAFNFKGDHYWKHMLYRKTKFIIYTYTGQQLLVSDKKNLAVAAVQPRFIARDKKWIPWPADLGTQESWRSELAGATSVAMKPCPAARRTLTSRRR